jgi:isocitrate dehydrogenase
VVKGEIADPSIALIKEKLILPFVDLKTEYYDLGLKNRDDTGDEVTRESARAILRLKVGVKCATITSNAARQEEYGLKGLLPSPNATIRAALDGMDGLAEHRVSRVRPSVSTWKKPIVIGRHAYGDVYKNAELYIPAAGKVELVYTAGGSLAMMTSVLVSPAGVFEYEAAHGTVQRHYYRWRKGEKTSTNPVALIFAWTGALAKQ